MNVKEMNQTLINFWDGHFEQLKPEVIKKEDFTEPSSLFDKVKCVADHCEKVLDFGCGSGYALFYASLFGQKMKMGLGIDTSKKAIDYANKTKDLSKMETIDFRQGDHHTLKNLEARSFDGLICSNVLDVVPYETSKEMIDAIDRILKPGGLLLLKLNFYLTEEMIERIKMVEIDKNTYSLNGVLRGMNLTVDEWVSRFNGYDLLEVDEYQRIQKGPKDRIVLMKKKY